MLNLKTAMKMADKLRKDFLIQYDDLRFQDSNPEKFPDTAVKTLEIQMNSFPSQKPSHRS